MGFSSSAAYALGDQVRSGRDSFLVVVPDDLRFACPLCGRKWRQARSVIQHLESVYHRGYPEKAAKADAALASFRAGLIE